MSSLGGISAFARHGRVSRFLANSEAFGARSEVRIVPSPSIAGSGGRSVGSMAVHASYTRRTCTLRAQYARARAIIPVHPLLFPHNSRMPKHAKIIPGIISAGLIVAEAKAVLITGPPGNCTIVFCIKSDTVTQWKAAT